jgi:uncharacterized protein with PIN domain
VTIPVRIDENANMSCPYCAQPLRELVAVPVDARMGKRFAYGCPDCGKLLSVSHRKGFWMG